MRNISHGHGSYSAAPATQVSVPRTNTVCRYVEATDSAVITILDHPTRGRLDMAFEGRNRMVHVDSADAAIGAFRTMGVRALLLAPSVLTRVSLARVSHLIRMCRGVPVVAIMSDQTPIPAELLLGLGARGVRYGVDLSARQGWQDLRSLLLDDEDPTQVRILQSVIPSLVDASRGMREFFSVLIRAAPKTRTVRTLACELAVGANTLSSRFCRAELPSVRRYLDGVRLIYAIAYLEQVGATQSYVSRRLRFSSPQAFSRQIRRLVSATVSEFRSRNTFDGAVEQFLRSCVVPFYPIYRSFDPIYPGASCAQ